MGRPVCSRSFGMVFFQQFSPNYGSQAMSVKNEKNDADVGYIAAELERLKTLDKEGKIGF
jgi:hypothetical protein